MADPTDSNEADPAATAAPRRGSGVVAALAKGLGLTVVVTVGTFAGQFLNSLVGGHGGGHDAAAPAAREAGTAPKEEAKAEEAKAPPLYQAFEPLIVNFEEQGQLHFLQVTVEVMARDPKTIAAVQANTPVLRNDLLLLIGSRDMKQLLTREGKEELRTTALQEIQKTMKSLSAESRVEDLYFTGFVMQ